MRNGIIPCRRFTARPAVTCTAHDTRDVGNNVASSFTAVTCIKGVSVAHEGKVATSAICVFLAIDRSPVVRLLYGRIDATNGGLSRQCKRRDLPVRVVTGFLTFAYIRVSVNISLRSSFR